MSVPMPMPEDAARELLQPDRRRTRELFRYLRATSAASTYSDLRSFRDPESNQRAIKLSSDPTLTALAQLVVHKLGVKRAFISLVDDQTQTILAEATRSVSLLDAESHDEGDSLYLGATSVPLDFGLTPHSVQVFTNKDPSKDVYTSNVTLNASRFVILDMSKEPRYKDRSYVTGKSHMRFCAIVPLTSPAGFVVGTMAAVDSEPREAFSEKTVSMLQEISTAVVGHLNVVKTTDELGRAERLLEAVNLFVQGESTLRDMSFRDYMARDVRRTTSDANAWVDEEYGALQTSGLNPRGARSQNLAKAVTPLYSHDTISSLPTDGENSHDVHSSPAFLDRGDQVAARRSKGSIATASEASDIGPVPDLHNINLGDMIDANFGRASNLMREAMDLEGMVFLSTATSSREGYTKNRQSPEPADTASGSETLYPSQDPSIKRPPLKKSEEMARRLGYATKVKSSLGNNAVAPNRFSLPQSLLQRLLRRYPYGKIFNFDKHGTLSASSEDDRILRDYQRRGTKPRKPRSRSKKERGHDHDTDSALIKCLPGARSVLFCPLWDNQNEGWFGGGLGWTTDSTRTFTGSEVTYVAAFSNSIMSEIARLEIWATDVAKSDFISSISHELRSPLHGVLGSAELLAVMLNDPRQSQLVEMIQQCGTTLLDTMNHLLDFAKINSLMKKNAGSDQVKAPDIETMERGGGIDLVAIFDISLMVEELSEGLLVGHRFKNLGAARDQLQPPLSPTLESGKHEVAMTLPEDPPVCILKIDREPIWVIKSEVGAWKRIVQNLLGNALKYTKSGQIEVSLAAKALNEPSKDGVGDRRTIVLCIKDTGQGIGKRYLENFLFKAFAQENNLSDGTGLGLSIVKQIVTSLGGDIQIDSEIGIGTSVKVALPVEFLPEPPGAGIIEDHFRLRWQGRNLSIIVPKNLQHLTVPEDPSTAGLTLRRFSTLERSLTTHGTQWYGLNVKKVQVSELGNADLVVVFEDDLEHLETEDAAIWRTHSFWRVIIICRGATIDQASKRFSTWQVQYLPSPYGPKRMGQALSALLDSGGPEATGKAVMPGWVSSADAPSPSVSPTSPALHRPSHTRAVSAPEHQSINDISSTTKALHVLCVDDNSINLKMLTGYMQRLKYTYEAAVNGLEAVNAVRKTDQPFDFILMDISMPVMDGLAATREIRQIEQKQEDSSKRAIVIALTGLGSAKAQHEALYSGVDHFLTKPVSMQKLRELLSSKASATS